MLHGLVWRIADRLYLGNYRSGSAALAGATRPVPPQGEAAHFAGVVSLCPMPLFPDDAPIRPAHPSIEWLLTPILDGGNGHDEFEDALGRSLPFIREQRVRGNVLVHCAAGMSRSVSIIAGLMCEDGEHPETAYRSIAEAKARALEAEGIEQDFLIAPAWEFQTFLERRFGRR